MRTCFHLDLHLVRVGILDLNKLRALCVVTCLGSMLMDGVMSASEPPTADKIDVAPAPG